MQQLDVRVETKTKDNVFLTTVVSVQYQVIREKAYQAFYALTNTQQQITAHIYDVMRSQLPTLELDAVFEAKEDLALAVKNALQETMSGYGYQILQALITDIDPDQRVKNAMNEINSAKVSVPIDFNFMPILRSHNTISSSPVYLSQLCAEVEICHCRKGGGAKDSPGQERRG